MSEARDTLLEKIAAAETTPVSSEALTALADAKSALEKAVAEAGARMEVLRDILDTAAPLLARLVPEVDKLRAHARAPQADAEEIRKDAASLLTASDDFTDLAKIDTAGLTVEAARGLEAKIFAIEERMARLNSETEAAIAKVEAAEKLATAAVSSPKGRTFSKAQRDAFADQIDAQLKRFAGDLTLADDVAGELGKLAAGFATLSRALQSYEKRIAGVTRPAPDTLSTKETATLDAAEKAARDALDAVLTL